MKICFLFFCLVWSSTLSKAIADEVVIRVDLTFDSSDLEKFADPQYASIEVFSKDGKVISSPVRAHSKSVFEALFKSSEVELDAEVFLLLNLAPKEIFRYHLGGVEDLENNRSFSFKFIVTQIHVDVTSLAEFMPSKEEAAYPISGHLSFSNTRHAFIVPLQISQDLTGNTKFLALPNEEFEIEANLFPQFSASETGRITLRSTSSERPDLSSNIDLVFTELVTEK